MEELDLDAAMLVYLGGKAEAAAIQPAGMEKRLQKMYGDSSSAVKKTLDGYLSAMMRFPIDPSIHTLQTVSDAVAHWLSGQIPQFSEITRRKMAVYYTYCIAR